MKRQPDHRTVTMLRTLVATGNAARRAQALRELERLGVEREPGGPLTRMMEDDQRREMIRRQQGNNS